MRQVHVGHAMDIGLLHVSPIQVTNCHVNIHQVPTTRVEKQQKQMALL
jgi:hypothetical protein